MKIVEDAERRRVREEGEEAEAEAEAEAERREVEVWKRQIKWMMLPARFREADTPEGMDPATSHAAVEAERARRRRVVRRGRGGVLRKNQYAHGSVPGRFDVREAGFET